MKIDINEYIRKEIPMLDYQQIKVAHYNTQSVCVTAPLEQNRNLHQTGYAGALSSIMIVSAWLLVDLKVKEHYPQARVVLQNCQVNYLRPVTDEIFAESAAPESDEWEQCINSLEKKGLARIHIQSRILQQNKKAASFIGLFHITQKKG